MRFKKTAFWIFVLTVMSITCLVVAASNVISTGDCGKNVTYTIDGNGVLTLSGSGATDSYRHGGDTPWYNDRNAVKKAVIENGITSLGDNLFFDMQSITEIVIPSSVMSISDSAITYCDCLEKIQVSSSSHYFCNDADGVLYSKNGKTLIHYPDGLALDSYTVPSTVTKVGDNAFLNSLKLKKISVSADNTAFSSDSYGILYNKGKTKLIVCPTGSEITDMTIPETVESIGDHAFKKSKIESVTMGNGVTYLGVQCFENCVMLKSINFSNNLKSIEEYAFHGCIRLSKIVIPEGVEALQNGAFYNCFNVRSISLPSTLKSIGGSVFYLCHNVAVIHNNSDLSTGISCIKLIDKNGTVSIKKNHEIDQNGLVFAKSGSNYLLCNYVGEEETVTLPSTYKEQAVKISRFTGVKHIIISEGIKRLEPYAIDCDIVETVTLPDSITYLDYNSIGSSLSLREIHLGSEASLDSSALVDCRVLEKITVSEDNKYYTADENGILYNKTGTALIFCPPAIPLPEVNIKHGVTLISDNAFRRCQAKSIILPDTLKTIHNNAFRDAEISSIRIPASVNNIYSGAFGTCKKLAEITVDESNLYFCSSNGVLYNKDKTELIAYPSGALREEFTIPDGVQTIGNHAFYGWKNLRKITLPSSIKNIEPQAFFAGKFDTVIISDGITAIPDASFYMCNGLGKIHIPDSVTSISDTAFNMSEPYTIICNKNSYAMSYAKDNSIPYAIVGLGDANCDGIVDLKDVTHIRRALAGGYGVSIDKDYADANCDGAVDLKDVTYIRRALAGGYGITLN